MRPSRTMTPNPLRLDVRFITSSASRINQNILKALREGQLRNIFHISSLINPPLYLTYLAQLRQDLDPITYLEAKYIPIQNAYLISRTNSRVSDIPAAAAAMEGHKAASGVWFFINCCRQLHGAGRSANAAALGRPPFPLAQRRCRGMHRPRRRPSRRGLDGGQRDERELRGPHGTPPTRRRISRVPPLLPRARSWASSAAATHSTRAC